MQIDLANARIAIVHDWLDTWRGGEIVLAEVVGLFPQADLFALVDALPEEYRARLLDKRARTSFLQRLPGGRRHFRKLLPLFPRAIESLDVASYDLVLSISHAVAKGVHTRPGQLHLCYCLTPMRYAWDMRDAYFSRGSPIAWLRPVADRVLDRLREWDRNANAGVTEFAAISQFIAERIARNYGRSAKVIYPPVDTDFYCRGDKDPSRDFYFTASRWVPYKRLDAIVAAFAELPSQRLIVAGDGPDATRIRAAAGANVTFVGEVPRVELRELMRNARAFVFAAEEDFGIVPLEAQACGTPVIAFARGGALETIVNDGSQPTGSFFPAQSAGAIAAAVRAFESHDPVDPAACRRNAERFGALRFRREFADFVGVHTAANAGATP